MTIKLKVKFHTFLRLEEAHTPTVFSIKKSSKHGQTV